MPAAVPERINLFRMVHHANIAQILEHGVFIQVCSFK